MKVLSKLVAGLVVVIFCGLALAPLASAAGVSSSSNVGMSPDDIVVAVMGILALLSGTIMVIMKLTQQSNQG